MNLGDKQGLDKLLEGWPAPLPGGEETATGEQEDERRWDTRADAIVKAALEEKAASEEALDKLFAPPTLAPEAGESGVVLLSGEKKMTQDKEPGEPASPTTAPPPADRKRPSLKEMAARASQAGARPSSPGTPPPSSVVPIRPSQAGSPGRPATVTPLPRPVEAGKDDSGVINLNVVHASVTAQQMDAAEKAKPGQEGLFDDDKTVESAADPAQRAALGKPTNVAVIAAPKKSNAGPIAGIAIAVLGIAAAFAIVTKKPPPPPVVADARPAAATVAVTAAPPPAATSTAVAAASADPTPAATAEPENSKPAEPGRPVVATGPLPTGAPAASSKDAVADPKLAAKGAPTAAEKPGDLQSEMARAVGPAKEGDKGAALPTPEPAAGGARNQNIPEQPSQGSLQAAIGTVIGGAKACVAGADDISRAQVTFSSGGSVTSVSVSGWAAAHGKSACIQAALKGAKVGPFSKPNFILGVPIRP